MRNKLIKKKQLDNFLKEIIKDIDVSKKEVKYAVMNEVLSRQVALARILILKGLLKLVDEDPRKIIEASAWTLSMGKEKDENVVGYIYIVESGGYHKIGKAMSVRNRVGELQVGNPNPIQIVLQKEVVNVGQIEKDLLDLFKDKKVRGEWFQLTDEDIKLIDKILTQTIYGK